MPSGKKEFIVVNLVRKQLFTGQLSVRENAFLQQWLSVPENQQYYQKIINLELIQSTQTFYGDINMDISILIDVLNSLPEKCKEVFELSCLEGMKYKDIAAQLNISVNTVKSLRVRAVELLKEKLTNESELLFILLFL